jgi:hypothetical protein
MSAVLALAALLVALTLPVLAGEPGKEVKLTGWITDEWCGSKNANADGKSCALSCAKKGAALVLYSEGKSYKLSDQKAAADNVGAEVEVTGTLASDGTIQVSGIASARKDAKKA